MRKLLHSLHPAMLIPLLLALLLPANAAAHDFEVDGIYYNIVNGEAVVTFQGASSSDYNNEYSGNVVIPATVTNEGTTFSVTHIGNRAFASCSGLTSVDIANSVTDIGDYAFASCSGLTSINIPNSVTSIGNFAFNNCWRLTSINLPNSITSIGNFAFYCSGLTSINIPSSVTSISNYAFSGCSGVTSVVVASDNPIYDSRSNCNAIIETASNTLISGCQNSVIPNSVTTIGTGAFSNCTGLTSVTIPNSVTTIYNEAFWGCTGLTSITIPNSVTTLGSNVLTGCSGLTSVTVAGDNPFYDSRNNCNAIIETASNMLICGCQNTVIPNSVTAIGSRAFYNCTGLTSITIPNSVTAIGNRAFYNCTGLTSITIPNSVTAIGDYAFYYCDELNDVYSYVNPENVTMGNSVFIRSELSDCVLHVLPFYVGIYQQDSRWSQYFGNIVEMPSEFEVDGIYYRLINANEVAVIYKYGHKYTGDVIIPETINPGGMTYSVTTIGGGAFEGCVNLTSVSIPNSVSSIGEWAFTGCTKLASINIPNSVTSIGDYAFRNCIKLANVNIPNSVTTIGEKAFAYCYRLTEITVPESVTTIGLTTFSYCYSLAQVTWNARNCTLEYDFFDEEDHLPFAYCPSLKKITIGSEVESIDDEIFCIYDPVYNNIDTVVCLADVPPVISEYCFFNHTYQNATLSVPKASEASYATATGWKEFVNRTTIEPHENILAGDVDGDGKVTIGDVADLIDYLLNGDSHSINALNADVDGDRNITIGDVADLIDKLLGKN